MLAGFRPRADAWNGPECSRCTMFALDDDLVEAHLVITQGLPAGLGEGQEATFKAGSHPVQPLPAR